VNSRGVFIVDENKIVRPIVVLSHVGISKQSSQLGYGLKRNSSICKAAVMGRRFVYNSRG